MEIHVCTSCGKPKSSVIVLDVEGFDVQKQEFLCDPCAQERGLIAPAASPFHSPTVETLLGLGTPNPNPEAGTARLAAGSSGPPCPGCGMTLHEFKVRGRLGCARCYDAFREALLPVLERVHDATTHRGRFPGPTTAVLADASAGPANLEDLRRRLRVAIDAENYEEAARLRDLMSRGGSAAGETEGSAES